MKRDLKKRKKLVHFLMAHKNPYLSVCVHLYFYNKGSTHCEQCNPDAHCPYNTNAIMGDHCHHQRRCYRSSSLFYHKIFITLLCCLCMHMYCFNESLSHREHTVAQALSCLTAIANYCWQCW